MSKIEEGKAPKGDFEKQVVQAFQLDPNPYWFSLVRGRYSHPISIDQSAVPNFSGEEAMPLLAAHVASVRDARISDITMYLASIGLPFGVAEEGFYALEYIYTVSFIKGMEERSSSLPRIPGIAKAQQVLVDNLKGRFYAIEEELQGKQPRNAVSLTGGMRMVRDDMMRVRSQVEKRFL